MNCPREHEEMASKTKVISFSFRGGDISVESEVAVCPVCGLEGATVEDVGKLQRKMKEIMGDRIFLNELRVALLRAQERIEDDKEKMKINTNDLYEPMTI